MTTVRAEDLLQVWEAHQRAAAIERAVAVLAIARPERSRDAWLQATIGERDGALFAVQQGLFGAGLHTTTACPACGEPLESDFKVSDVGGHGPDTAEADLSTRRLQWSGQGYDVEYRLPCSDDLLRLADGGVSGSSAVQRLMARCIYRACQGGQVIEPTSLPEGVIACLGDEMARHDPAADVCVALQCPACATAWETRFDIVSYFWGELDDWAQQTLATVHTLARNYGWSERAILALSPTRRQMYLDLVCG